MPRRCTRTRSKINHRLPSVENSTIFFQLTLYRAVSERWLEVGVSISAASNLIWPALSKPGRLPTICRSERATPVPTRSAGSVETCHFVLKKILPPLPRAIDGLVSSCPVSPPPLTPLTTPPPHNTSVFLFMTDLCTCM